MQLLSFLPALCSISDLENYWQEWKHVGEHKETTKLVNIVEKLSRKGMIHIEKQ
jgi:hypothetical protein